MELTKEQLKAYTQKDGQAKRWKCYDESVKFYDALRIHADGEYPRKLIDERRPSESEEIKEYRKKIYEPMTQIPFSKVITSLSKIRKSSDWAIKYNPMEVPKAILEAETPQAYFETSFPYFGSVTDWLFNVALKEYLLDSNGVVVIMPLELDIPTTAYLRPFPFIFNSNLVYDFVEEQYCVLYSTDKATYNASPTVVAYDGDIYYVVTDKRIQRYDQINSAGDLELMVDYEHNLPCMPAFRLKGFFKKALDKTFMWKSRIASIVPGLNEAVREYSDLQAEVVQHIHSTMWMYATQDCVECKGFGQVSRDGRTVTCEVCKGQGKVNASPYAHQVIRPPQVGETAIPNPPMGYVQKQVEIVNIQDARIDKHIYKALSAINMEFLEDTPMNESGKAKEVDRDELNVFVNSIATDIVNIMRNIYQMGNDYRYRLVVPKTEDRAKLMPTFSIPEKFDLLSSNFLIGEIQAAKTGKVDASIVNELEVEYATKKFTGEPKVMGLVRLTLLLDPFPGIEDDFKMTRLQAGGISKLDYVISCNIHQFVKRAIEDDEQFMTMDFDDQRDVLEEYAQEVLDANDAAAQLRLKQAQAAMNAPSSGNQTDVVNSDNQDQNNPGPPADKQDVPAGGGDNTNPAGKGKDKYNTAA